MRNCNKDFNDEVIVGLILSTKDPNLGFRCLAQEAVDYPDREEACFTMMEQGPAYGDWNEFCYVPVDKRLALGEAVQPTDIIVCLSQRVAGLSVEKMMIVFATMYYSEVLDNSNVSLLFSKNISFKRNETLVFPLTPVISMVFLS